MLEQYLGEQRFREGVSHYLRTHAYGNTETSDLWDAIEHTAGEPVRRLMDSWIWQPGFPLVSATLDGDQLVLRQQRFAFGETADTASWVVPVLVRNGDAVERGLLEEAEVRIPLADPDAAVVVNAGGHGFYRVAYSAELRQRLSGAPSPVSTRWSASTSSTTPGRRSSAGRLTGPDFLALAEGFAGEREYAVWQAILIGLRGLGRFLSDDDFPRYQVRVAALLRPVVGDLGDPVEGESDLTGKLRGLVTGALAVLGGDEPTVDRCRRLFEESTATPGAVDPELVAAATSVVAATGGEDDFDRLFDAYKNASTPQDQLRHLFALAEFDDEALVLRACELGFGGDVKSQNAPYLLRSCIANRRHGAAAWTFVRQRWDDANAAFPDNSIARMIDTVTLLTEPSVVADVQGFFAEHPIPQAAKTLDQILERQRVNSATRLRERERLAAAL